MKLADIITTEYEEVEEKVSLKQKAKLKKDNALLRAYDLFNNEYIRNTIYRNSRCEEILLEETRVEYSPEELTAFSLLLPEIMPYEAEYNASMFLSQAIRLHAKKRHEEKLPQEKYCIITEGIREGNEENEFTAFARKMIWGTIEVYGNLSSEAAYQMKNGNLTVYGSVQNESGYQMDNGTIVIEGNCERSLGYHMRYGKILVKKNAGNFVGLGMFNGEITVLGNAGYDIGLDAKGGIIRIAGEIGSIAMNTRAHIYHKGEKIR